MEFSGQSKGLVIINRGGHIFQPPGPRLLAASTAASAAGTAGVVTAAAGSSNI